MKQTRLKAFLDDINIMTIIVDQQFYHNEYQLNVYENKQPIKFIKQNEVLYDKVYKLTLKVDKDVNLRENWRVTLDESLEAEVLSGKVVRTEKFIKDNHYTNDDLGMTYLKDYTIFKLWAPIAKKVHLLLESRNGTKETLSCSYVSNGVWSIKVNRHLDGYAYIYNVYVNGGWKKVKDPYAIASKANGEAAYVVDDSKTFVMSATNVNDPQPFIYEVSVRDFSSDETSPFKYPRQFLGMIEEGLKTRHGKTIGFDYIKKLGITHIQLMPVYDFTGIDELHPKNSYNWGYNPSQYFVPEGSYATDPNHPYKRVDELKQLVDTYHKNNLGVIMDVVYNHVDLDKKFPYEILVPGYTFRVNDKDIMTDFSGCGNDLNTTRPMIRKLIIDSLKRWTRFYKMDGFRFDLMGLIDVDTMNLVESELSKINPNILIYGEGWKMNDNDQLAYMHNDLISPKIGFFNDQFRDTVKGSTFNLIDKGFAFGNMDYQSQISLIFKNLGSLNPKQSINYVECHDNHTFFDKAMTICENETLARSYQLVATCITILAPGTPFLHLGQEFYRSKKGVGNSYNVSDDINAILWYDVERYSEDIKVIKQCIEWRKKFYPFSIKNLHTFDEGYVFDVDKYRIFVLVKESELVIEEGYELVFSTTKNHHRLKDVGIFIYERKSIC